MQFYYFGYVVLVDGIMRQQQEEDAMPVAKNRMVE
jgi:hypothetical protein